MCVRPTQTCLFIGMLIPAMRAMCPSLAAHPLQKSAAFYGKLPLNSPACLPSALPLLVARIGADDVHHAAAADDLAVLADLLDGRTNLHMENLPPQPPGPLRP